MRTLGLVLLVLGLPLVAACDDEVVAVPSGFTFRAFLNGGNVVADPPIDTDAAGIATVTVDGPTASYRVEITRPIDDVSAAHIHGRAAVGVNAGVMVPFSPEPTGTGFTGVLDEGTFEVTDEVLDAILAGETYVNVHTNTYPGGEIRGQLFRQ